jgi:mRNA interferase RelE/StbE
MARMRYEIILAAAALEDLRRLRAFERSAVRDAFEQFLRHEPTRTSKSRIKRASVL